MTRPRRFVSLPARTEDGSGEAGIAALFLIGLILIVGIGTGSFTKEMNKFADEVMGGTTSATTAKHAETATKNKTIADTTSRARQAPSASPRYTGHPTNPTGSTVTSTDAGDGAEPELFNFLALGGASAAGVVMSLVGFLLALTLLMLPVLLLSFLADPFRSPRMPRLPSVIPLAKKNTSPENTSPKAVTGGPPKLSKKAQARADQKARQDDWSAAVARHMAIKDAYADLLHNPVAALERSALWDVTCERTQVFHDRYGTIEDLYQRHGDTAPTNDTVITKYADATRRAERAWESANRFASREGLSWLPAQQRTFARRAIKMLKVAASEASSPAEQAAAIQKAKDLLDSMTSVHLPLEIHAEIESRTRRQLIAASAR